MSQPEGTIQSTQGQPADAKPEQKAALKLFTLADVNRVVTVPVHWPHLYPGFAPWVFKLRLALSDKMQKKREEWLALPIGESSEKDKFREECLDEICDLLTDVPTGFGDLKDPRFGQPGQNPGSVFRNYVTAATSQDGETKETIYKIIEAVSNSYWSRVSPREFHQAIPNSNS
jgi:hypothetical protein